MDQNMDPAFQFARPESSSKGHKPLDTSVPIAQDETPQIQRNRRLREGSMAAIASEEEADERVGRNQERTTGHRRRKSSLSRGKRISSAFDAGIICRYPRQSPRRVLTAAASPPNSVPEATFFKHIDCDLPETERVRQLLIWCAIRSSGSNPVSRSSTPVKPKPIPGLTDRGAEVSRRIKDDFIRRLVERKASLNLYGGPSQAEGSKLKENQQNTRNKDLDVKYSQDIRQWVAVQFQLFL
jgi:kinetochore protein Mis13/DSN1